jgi:tetratricopeptide (TPR) repeat protein
MAAAAPTATGWLRGPASDLFFGTGLSYLPFFVAFALAGSTVQAAAPYALLPIAALLTATPHYGATLLRVYESPSDRRRYAVFSVGVTALVWALFVAGVYDVWIGSWILTVYFTWSPWHYTGQNYGIALMFLGRRGVRIGARIKRLLYASFLLSFVLTFLAVHVEQAATVYAPLEVGNVAYDFRPLGIPALIAGPLLGLCFVGYVVTTLAAFGVLARQAGLRALGPTLAVTFSQALWFVVPIVLRGSQLGESIAPLASANGEYVFVWISFAHSLQYLWITAAYAKRTSDYPGGLRYYGRSLIAGSAIWGLPIVLFLPSALGTHAFDAGLYALVAASVNLHHFVLDGAVWKLRDGRIARALLGSGAEHANAEPRRSLRWLGVAFLVFGGGYALLNLAAMVETGWSMPRAFERGDRARLETAARRLHWIGRDSKDTYLQIANLASSAGDATAARAAVVRSLEITPSAIGYVNLGILDAGEERLASAQLAFERALALEPGSAEARYRLGLLHWRRGNRLESLRLLEEAAGAAPERTDIRDALSKARAAKGPGAPGAAPSPVRPRAGPPRP